MVMYAKEYHALMLPSLYPVMQYIVSYLLGAYRAMFVVC